MIFSQSLIKGSLSQRFTIYKMFSEQRKTYQEAITALNNLQTNSQYLKNATVKPKAETNLAEVTKFLNRTGLPLEELDKLSVIHVAGTNGKGTTCAYTESILRNHGFKTGFYSSPHMLDVRERIRIDGKPISKKEFATCFWKIYDVLDKQKTGPEDMPLYFRYLTILAFHVFLKHNVDVAIVEVGIGGEYDCTNVLRNTAVVAITPLDFDHTSLLGQSIESIAWNKGGIMKNGSVAFTAGQPEPALKVLKERSVERNCDLRVIENNYKYENKSSFPSRIQRINASLALAVSKAYMERSTVSGPQKNFSMEIARKAIEETYWPGRYEIKLLNKMRFLLDGAHTLESMIVCTNWFKEKTDPHRRKALIFNLTGDRPSDIFFRELQKVTFSTVIFTPNVSSEKDVADNTDFILTPDTQLRRCNQYKDNWLKMEESIGTKAEDVLVFPCVSQAVKHIDDGTEYDVLVTGSIHLVGAALAVLDPSLNGTLED